MFKKKISVIVPVHNEEGNIQPFYDALLEVARRIPHETELIFVNDGSTDRSGENIERLAQTNPNVKYIEFSRNFGKEIATTAGLHASRGDAAIIIDADLQHPIELIPEFLSLWEQGAEVVVGVRKSSKSDSLIKRIGSPVFYLLMSMISETKHTRNATDYRLLDRVVIDEFNRCTERERITRGLIDWLGFRRALIYFDANERTSGEASYGVWKLVKLAIEGFISHSLFPLRFAAYIGTTITVLSGILGIVMFFDRYFMTWGLNFSGTAILADIILFLVGIVLMCIGLLAFYIGSIYRESQNRPMYVVRKRVNMNGL